MTLTEDQVYELWHKVSTFDCPTHPDGGCNPHVCLECQTPFCGEARGCACECDCSGGEQGDGLCALPHEIFCKSHRLP